MTTTIYSISCLIKKKPNHLSLYPPLQNQHFGTKLVVRTVVQFPAFPAVMCLPTILAAIKSAQRGRKMRFRTIAVPNVPQNNVHTAHRNRACSRVESTGLQAPQQGLQNTMCLCFLATNKPMNNRTQNMNLKVQ